jgi:hypothetical protein
MKPTLAIAVGICSLLVSLTSNAGSLGQISMGGTGCSVPSGSDGLVAVPGQKNRFSIPLQVVVNKKDDTLVRKTCAFRLPAHLAANEKVVVSNAAQWVRLGASTGGQVKTNLEIFLAGSRGNPLTTEVKAITKPARLFQTVRAEGVIAESACGQDTIIGGNLSALASGPAQATAAVGNLLLTMKIVSCQ